MTITMQGLTDAVIAIITVAGVAVVLALAFIAAGAVFERGAARGSRARAGLWPWHVSGGSTGRGSNGPGNVRGGDTGPGDTGPGPAPAQYPPVTGDSRELILR